MKKTMILLSISLATSFCMAQGKPKELPPEIRSQLTEEQISQLESATSREEKRALLESWGIEMRPPPHGDRHKGPPPKLDEETKSQLDALKTKYEAASTDEEKEEIREQMRELFHASHSDDDKRGVRRFFKDHPSKGDATGAGLGRPGNR